jgi:hypothetical protein
MATDFERDFPQPTRGADSPAAPGLTVRFHGEAEAHAKVITLAFPLEIEGEVIVSLTVRRPTAGDMVRVVEAIGGEADDAELIRHVTAAMISWPIEVLDALSPDDAGRVAAAAIPFLPARIRAALEAMETESAGEAAPV